MSIEVTGTATPGAQLAATATVTPLDGSTVTPSSASWPYEMVISLEEQGGRTRVTWRMRHATASECARVEPFVVEANEQNFDRLAAELASSPSTG